MKAKILKHKTAKGCHGMIRGSMLFRTGPCITPQLFPKECDKEWLGKSVKNVNSPHVKSLDDFDLVNVTITEDKK